MTELNSKGQNMVDADLQPIAVRSSSRLRTEAEWDQHRENITFLYRTQNLKLTEVAHIMEQIFGFRATKRQYLGRIKRWKLFKNLKAHEKEALIEMTLKKSTQIPRPTQLVLHNRVVDVKRLNRHLRSSGRRPVYHQRHRDGVGSNGGHVHVKDSNIEISADRNMSKILGSSMVSPPEAVSPRIEQHALQCQVRTDDDNSETAADWETSDTQAYSRDDALDGTIQEHIHGIQQPCRVRTLPNSSTTLTHLHSLFDTLSTTEIIFVSTRNLVNASQTSVPIAIMDGQVLKSMEATGTFEDSLILEGIWTDVQNAIYMLKTSRSSNSWQFLHRACDEFLKSTDFGLLTLKHIFSTLSPANLTIYLQLGVQMIGYIAQVLRLRHGTVHPLYFICEALLQDSGQAEVSTRGLEVMLRCLSEHHSDSKVQLRLQVQEGLIMTHRRSGNFKRAHDLCSNQIELAIDHFGRNSREARAAKSELVHILNQSGRTTESMTLCEEIVFGDETNLTPPILDEQTVWALEDLAEYHQNLGDPGSSRVLLQQAYNIALGIWTETSSSPTCIMEKLKAPQASPVERVSKSGRTGRFVSLFTSELQKTMAGMRH